MGKGDRKSRKGKMFMKSFGVRRPGKKNNPDFGIKVLWQ
jgi:ribosomal small subunit protein bTHX